MSFTLDQLTLIENAIATGELRVVYDGIETLYRSIDDLKKAREIIRADLQANGLLTTKTRTSYAMRVKD